MPESVHASIQTTIKELLAWRIAAFALIEINY